MVVDLAFELSYLLSDATGLQVEVVSYQFDPDKALLCIKALVDGGEREACVEVRACRGLSDSVKQARCLSKTLTASEKLVRTLADQLGHRKPEH